MLLQGAPDRQQGHGRLHCQYVFQAVAQHVRGHEESHEEGAGNVGGQVCEEGPAPPAAAAGQAWRPGCVRAGTAKQLSKVDPQQDADLCPGDQVLQGSREGRGCCEARLLLSATAVLAPTSTALRL